MIHAVVLAAGASSRYGTDPPKQREYLPRVLAAVRKSVVPDVVVVTGAHALETDARTVYCPEWERGPGASLRCGFAALPDDAAAVVVVLADGPNLDARAIDRVVAAWHFDGGDVYACTYGGVRLHPVLLARKAWPLVPDAGARALEARLVECDDLTPPGDIDVKPQT